VQSATGDVTHVLPTQRVDDSGVDDQDVGGGAVPVRALPAFAGAELEGGREGGREGGTGGGNVSYFAQGVDDSGIDDQVVEGRTVPMRALPAFTGAELEGGRDGRREGGREGGRKSELFCAGSRRHRG